MSLLTQIVNNHFYSQGRARTLPLPHKNTTAFYFLATDIETEHVVMGGYSNLLPLGILSVIFQSAFWCACVYCC